LTIIAANDSDLDAPVAALVVLRVTPDGQAPFFAHVPSSQTTFISEQLVHKPQVVAAHGTVDLSFWPGGESPPWFAFDTRLWKPGKYRLQVVMDDDLRDHLLDDPRNLPPREPKNEGLAPSAWRPWLHRV
jgi:hypothetical protein